ncbi:MAG: glycosyl transferase, group 1 family protein [Parcubacteria group bacterium Gr01-1014_48]|nr:MAG: glycosyl transferase, group 1 family protein [Parcubacteria group bacterium Greene0416_14]TSC74481.1 MAG: glycosyl transferase, group 1 family protein [Parcubacteria group bacterium Gr01-1014_48]TSD01792.1 MAG: glycosyl transferase, group 1 family protein [Parcubacteria group bacterium Greene1014_15]TSD08506.1 MAG: glycosyl transferase, group 1 family protein [Parcubacteria group bacterium Greene0714_4]
MSSIVKIAVIIRKLSVSGGAQRIALNVAYELQKAGNEVILYTFFCDVEKCFPELLKKFTVVVLPKNRYRETFRFLGFLLEDRMARDMAYMIDRATDILYPDDGPAHHVAYYYKKYIRNIPSVWNMNELPTMRWPLEMLPIIENAAFHDIPWRPLFLKKAMILLKTLYERKFIRAQNAIIVFDEFHKMMLRRYANCESIIIPSGLDTVEFPYIEKMSPRRRERLNLLSSGIFLSYRRFEDSIEAMALIVEHGMDPYLVILGEYSTDIKYYQQLKKLCKDRGVVQRVTFFGRYSDAELKHFFRESHIFVYPHLQSQGVAVNETIASGIPTIVTPLAGTYETLHDGVDAVFAEPRNPQALAHAIEKLVDSPELYQAISRTGARHMAENFSWNRQAKSVLEVMNSQIHATKI